MVRRSLSFVIVMGASAAASAQTQWVHPTTRHVYTFTPSAGTWLETAEQARAAGGHLAQISDAAEQAWVSSTIPMPSGTFIWLGARDHGVPDWTWTTGEPLEYTNWRPTEPDGLPPRES